MSDLIDRDKTVDAMNRLCDRVCQYSKVQRKVMCGAWMARGEEDDCK